MFFRSVRSWVSHLPLISLIIMLIALPTGFCEAWLWQNYVLHPAAIPILDIYFGTPAASIGFIIAILKLALVIFGISAIIYALHLAHGINPNRLLLSLRAGILKSFRVFALVFPVILVAWAPYMVQRIQAGDFTSPSVYWGIAITLYFIIKYPLVLPVLVIESESIAASMRKGARLSKGIRAEILLVILSFILLSEAACLALGYFFLPLLLGNQDTLHLVMTSSATYFTRWLFYSPALIAIYIYYREQLSCYMRSYLAA